MNSDESDSYLAEAYSKEDAIRQAKSDATKGFFYKPRNLLVMVYGLYGIWCFYVAFFTPVYLEEFYIRLGLSATLLLFSLFIYFRQTWAMSGALTLLVCGRLLLAFLSGFYNLLGIVWFIPLLLFTIRAIRIENARVEIALMPEVEIFE